MSVAAELDSVGSKATGLKTRHKKKEKKKNLFVEKLLTLQKLNFNIFRCYSFHSFFFLGLDIFILNRSLFVPIILFIVYASDAEGPTLVAGTIIV